MPSPQLPLEDPQAGATGLGYFIVRVRRVPGTPLGEVTGIVERLGTGEKRQFHSSTELARVVEDWSR
jgi:hypothetical protein